MFLYQNIHLIMSTLLLKDLFLLTTRIDKTIDLSFLFSIIFFILNIAKLFIAYNLILITWALIEVLYNKG